MLEFSDPGVSYIKSVSNFLLFAKRDVYKLYLIPLLFVL
jgi:hypothetical protein